MIRLFVDRFAPLRKFRDLLAAEDRFYGKLVGSLLVGFLAVAVLAVIFLFVSIRDHRLANQRMQTLEILRAANKIESDLANLETGHRGFLLTGQASYADSFNQRRALLEKRFEELRRRFPHDSAQAKRVSEVKRAVDSWLETIARPGFENRRREPAAGNNPADAVAASASASSSSNDFLGRPLIEEARKNLQLLQDEELRTLGAKSRDQLTSSLSFQTLVFMPKLESVISQMEKAEWGFLLTGDRTCIDVYRRAANEFYAFHGHLTVLLGDSPQQTEPLARIRTNLERWQREIALPEIAAKQEGKDVATMVTRGAGKTLMEQIRTDLESLDRDELAAHDRVKSREQLSRIARTIGVALLSLCALAVLVASSWYSFAAYNSHVRKIEAADTQTRSIIETSLDGVITIDAQGIMQLVNPAAEKMFALPAREMLGQSVGKIIPQRLFTQDMAKLGRGTMTTIGHRQNYYPFPIEISLSEMIVSERKQYVALIRDVTERKRTEDTLKHIGMGISSSTGEEFVRSLVKQLSKALQTDFSFVVETLRKDDEEDTACTLVLAEHGTIRSRVNYKLGNTACEDVLKKGFRAFQSQVREQFPKDELLRELMADSFVAMPLVDHKGKTVGLMGVIDAKPMQDIGVAESTLQIFAARAAAEIERKRFEEDLNAEKERLAVTLRSIGDGFIATDVEGRVVMVNNIAERLTGWNQQQMLGKRLIDVFNILNEKTRKPAQSAVQRIVETGSVVGAAAHAIIVSREGVERLIENSAAPIRDRHNQKLGIVLVFRDITEKEHLEAERRKAEKLESLGLAAGGIAHDFNNLLTAIIGNLSLTLLNLDRSDEAYERLTTAKKASIRAQDLAQQLLTFAKGGAPIKKTASIVQLIQDTVSFSLRGSSVKGEFWLPNDLWHVEIDSGQISQVINNLAINAEQAMPGGGTLRVRCENFTLPEESAALSPLRVGRYVKISVQDEGIGIPEEYLKKIFDPYFTTKPKGSGLGLATSYSIVKNHDGLITVDSKVGRGSTFAVYLPATDNEVVFLRPGEEPEMGSGRVLILDDEEVICEIVTATLTPLGYDVTSANDAMTAIQLYKEAMEKGRRFDAVISDLTIPGGMGGADAVKRLIEIDPKVKAIVSSGYATDPVMSRYQEYGFCACIAKPYELAALGRVVNEVISTMPAKDDEPLAYHDYAQSHLG